MDRCEERKKHEELLREVDSALEESRNLRARLSVLRHRVQTMERRVENILILHVQPPEPVPEPAQTPSLDSIPEPQAV